MQDTTAYARNAATSPRATWHDVRRWAASVGLTSADALAQWLDDITVDRVSQLDPYEMALVRDLQQYALAVQLDGGPTAPWRLASLYRPVLDALRDLDVRARLDRLERDDHVPSTDARHWDEPLVNPLAPEANILWPASPVTVTARIAQTVHQAFGYRPLDLRTFITSLAGTSPRDQTPKRRTAGDEVGAQLRTMDTSINHALDDLLGLRADPNAPPLAPLDEVDMARTRWPSVTPGHIDPPLMIAVGSGLFHGTPTHVAWLRSGPGIIGGVVVDDATGNVVDTDGVAAEEDTPDIGFGVYAPETRRTIARASGNQHRVVADFLADFARAARDGQFAAVGLLPVVPSESPMVGWVDHDVERIDYGRVVEPAEVLAALSARVRNGAIQDMQRAIASVGGLTRRVAEAYTGNILQANVPKEVRQLLAVQSASRACMPGATLAQRRLVLDAAAVLGVPVTSESTIESLCVASARAAARLYGGLQP
ncbi:hypothetical protein pmac_cds_765 [Pandoravirus macleodensis]|uniref:Uncharacterized protein n=1 Tax=Pandoravirus macleodensis TaxID=2107707 RepID=A0A2U7UG26_9VIRU|nr:hypothetical protein pmac_cds_765 [Pandoravirus macleodensis]AVK77453.1 hypothetical protein pmac_cds_765 [Pandoravirus macleodensis]